MSQYGAQEVVEPPNDFFEFLIQSVPDQRRGRGESVFMPRSSPPLFSPLTKEMLGLLIRGPIVDHGFKSERSSYISPSLC